MCVHLPVPCCGSHRRRPAPTWPCSSPPPQPPPPASGPGRSSAWLKQALQVWTGKSRVSIGRYIDHNKYRMTISRGFVWGWDGWRGKKLRAGMSPSLQVLGSSCCTVVQILLEIKGTNTKTRKQYHQCHKRVKGFYPEFQKQGSQSKQMFLAYLKVLLKF